MGFLFLPFLVMTLKLRVSCMLGSSLPQNYTPDSELCVCVCVVFVCVCVEGLKVNVRCLNSSALFFETEFLT